MEFRCSTCGHVGSPSQVLPDAQGGIVMVCSQCSGRNEVSLTDAGSDEPTQPKPKPVLQPTKKGPSEKELLETEAFEKLMPEPGDGFRCPKCVRLISRSEDHCPHCGLTMEVALRFGPFEGPWDSAPAGLESEFEQGTLLWKSVEQDPSDENFEKFVNFTDERLLHDLQVRRLRWFLVDHPNHDTATRYLKAIASSFQSKLAVAQATSKARAQKYEHATQDFRRKLMIGSAVFWTILVVVMLFLFFKSR